MLASVQLVQECSWPLETPETAPPILLYRCVHMPFTVDGLSASANLFIQPRLIPESMRVTHYLGKTCAFHAWRSCCQWITTYSSINVSMISFWSLNAVNAPP